MNGTTSASKEGVLIGAVLFAAAGIGLLAPATGGLSLALPLAVAGGLLFFVKPVLGMLLLVGTIPLESALMVGGRSAPALLGMAVVGAWAFRKLLRRESIGALFAPGLVKVGLLLFAFACLSVTWAAYPQGLERRLILLAQLMLLAVLVYDLASSRERLAMVAKVLVVAGAVAALLTIEQYFMGGARRAGAGVTGSINRTSITLVTIVPFAFYLLRSYEPLLWRLLGLTYIGLAAVAVAATFSRINFLVFPLLIVAHMVLMAQTRVGRRRVFVMGAAVVIALAFLPMQAIQDRAASIAPYLSQTVALDDSVETYSGRGFHILVGWEVFKDHPIVGAGYHNYNPHFLTYQWGLTGAARLYRSPRSPHSSHVGFLANLGLVGFSLWISLFIIGFMYVLRAWKSVPDPGSSDAFMVQAIGMALGLQLVYGMYGEIHQDKIFWVVIGLAIALGARHRRSPRGETYLQAREPIRPPAVGG